MSDEDELEVARERTLGYVVSFVRVLRREGAHVPADGSLTATRALAAIGLEDRERVRAALRASLVSSVTDLETFERLFPDFWRQFSGEESAWTPPEMDAGAPAERAETATLDGGSPLLEHSKNESGGGANEGEFDGLQRRSGSTRSGGAGAESDANREREAVSAALYSAVGTSTPVEEIQSHEDERARSALDRAITDLTGAVSRLRGRRWDRVESETPDVRRAIRRSVAADGAVFSLPTRGRARTDVRALLLVDVSRSVLDTIDRAFLLEFLARLRGEWRDVRVVFFDTDAREVTDAFDEPTAAAAAEALATAETEWGGGTRIGHAIETVRREDPAVVDRDTVVFVVSDGLEVGEIDRLEEGITWLSSQSAGVFWLNPLAASDGYEPTCRGMAASMPYVDGLFAFAGVEDVAELARQLGRRGLTGPLGYQYESHNRTTPRARNR